MGTCTISSILLQSSQWVRYLGVPSYTCEACLYLLYTGIPQIVEIQSSSSSTDNGSDTATPLPTPSSSSKTPPASSGTNNVVIGVAVAAVLAVTAVSAAAVAIVVVKQRARAAKARAAAAASGLPHKKVTCCLYCPCMSAAPASYHRPLQCTLLLCGTNMP